MVGIEEFPSSHTPSTPSFLRWEDSGPDGRDLPPRQRTSSLHHSFACAHRLQSPPPPSPLFDMQSPYVDLESGRECGALAPQGSS